MVDTTGRLPEWLKKTGEWLSGLVGAFFRSIEADVGLGFGVGVDFSDNFTAQFSRETYVGIDDGVWVTGNIITSEVSLLERWKIGNTYNHLVEKDFERVSTSGSAFDGPFDMIHYPDVEKGGQFSFGLLQVNSEGEWLLSAGVGAYVGAGGHVGIAFNLSEFWEMLKNLSKG